jgi:SAM-dependent methyltransferase
VEKLAKRRLSSAIELAAGPGYHAVEYARRGLRSLALDVEPAMVSYLRERAPDTLEVLQGDMRSFRLETTVDLAYTLFGSFCYLLTNDDVRAHFEAVWHALGEGGIYVIEIPHPRKWLHHDVTTQDQWTRERDGVRVTTRWDIDQAVPDPLTQCMEVRSEFEVVENGRRSKVRTRGRQRAFFAQEVLALAAGRFRVLGWYGAMDRKVPFDYARKAWRMVPVLQKIAG